MNYLQKFEEWLAHAQGQQACHFKRLDLKQAVTNTK